MPGNDIDHGKQSVAAIEGRGGTTNDFDPLNQVNINGELGPKHGFVVDVVIKPVSIDQQEDSGVEVARTGEASYSEISVVPVVGDKKAANGLEDVGQVR